MIVKKFKNGNITLGLEKSDVFYYDNDIDKIYHNEITMADLYFNQINGYMYLIDFNKNLIYDFSNCHINILDYFFNILKKNKKVKLYPLSKKDSKSLFQDLENEY